MTTRNYQTGRKLHKNSPKRIKRMKAQILAFSILLGALSIYVSYSMVVRQVDAQTTLGYIEHRTPAAELSVRSYILKEVLDAGLDPYEAAVIIHGESGGHDCLDTALMPFNVNKNGTIDVGVWRINSVHMQKNAKQYISLKDACDYKTATKWAIAKRKADGNWSAWVSAKKAGIK